MAFQAKVSSQFRSFKCFSIEDDLKSLALRNTQGDLIAWLKPVIKEWRRSDAYLPELLTRWRIENPTISTGKFVPTAERTAAWLDNLVIGRDDRLLFIVQGLDGTPLGHIGYSNFNFEDRTGELDSVLRGVKEGYPGLMTLASRRLVEWGYKTLGLHDVTLTVFSDNESAIHFYQKMGFVETHRKGLYKVFIPEKNEEKLEIADENYSGPIEKHYIYMKYEGKIGHDAYSI